MKKTVILSTLVAGLLFATTALQAEVAQSKKMPMMTSSGLHDNVGKKEEKALNKPSSVKGHAAAEAKVEETRDKDQFETKETGSAFKKEVKKDVKKVETPKEVKTIRAEDKHNPYN